GERAQPSKKTRWRPGRSSTHLRFARRERLDDAALGDRASAALADDAVQLMAQSLKIADLSLHLHQVLARDGIDRIAGPVALIGKPEEIAHLLDRETQIARPPDET